MSTGETVVKYMARALPFNADPDKASRIRRSAPIHAYVGSNGSGKSWLIARDTLPTLAGIPWHCTQPDHLHTMEGQTSGVRRVLSTMAFLADGLPHPLWVPLRSWPQLVEAEHCDLILDEVAGVASSRETSGLPPAVATTLQELRRRDVMVRWSAPAWPRADRILRETSTMVTLAMGMMRVPEDTRVRFVGPHEGCDQGEEHTHDSGREWRRSRLVRSRSYDAQVFDDFTLSLREQLRAVVSSFDWIPGSVAADSYDTLGEVLKLGQVTESGRCLDCGGTRRREKCTCDQRSLQRLKARWQTTRELAGGPDLHVVPSDDAEVASPAAARSAASTAAVVSPTALWAPPAAESRS